MYYYGVSVYIFIHESVCENFYIYIYMYILSRYLHIMCAMYISVFILITSDILVLQ